MDDEDERLKAWFLSGPTEPAAVNALFKALHQRYFDRLTGAVAQASAALRDRPDVCQEIAVESFVRLWKYRASYRGDSALYTYLCRIALNEVSDFFRKQNRSPEVADEADDDTGESTAVSLADAAAHVEWRTLGDAGGRDIDERRVSDCVQTRLAQLERKHPEKVAVIRMQYHAGLKGPDIAAAIGRTHGATREFLSQARELVRKALADCWKLQRGER